MRMPELSRFGGMVIYMLFHDIGQHNKPHVHVYYGEYEAAVAIDGELLAGSLPRKQLKIVTGWLAFHEEEAYRAWNLAVRGEHFEKIPPMNSGNTMYVLNDICYAGQMQDDMKVTEAKPLLGGMLLVTFSTGEKRLFDTTTLQGSAFKPLEDEAVFRNPVIFHGVITWNNGEIDIAPEAVYRDSYAYNSEAI